MLDWRIRSRTHPLAFCATMFLVLAGCGGSGSVTKQSMSGSVTQGGKPVRIGEIRFEPTEGAVNRETVAGGHIRDGRYRVDVVGGPHRVAIRDHSEDPSAIGSNAAPSPPLFSGEYHTKVELPAELPRGFTRDFEVPSDFK